MIVTAAPGMMLPLASVTVPEMEPVIVCAMTGKLSNSIVNRTYSSRDQRLFEVDMGKSSPLTKICLAVAGTFKALRPKLCEDVVFSAAGLFNCFQKKISLDKNRLLAIMWRELYSLSVTAPIYL